MQSFTYAICFLHFFSFSFTCFSHDLWSFVDLPLLAATTFSVQGCAFGSGCLSCTIDTLAAHMQIRVMAMNFLIMSLLVFFGGVGEENCFSFPTAKITQYLPRGKQFSTNCPIFSTNSQNETTNAWKKPTKSLDEPCWPPRRSVLLLSQFSKVSTTSSSKLMMGRCWGHASSHCPHWMQADAFSPPGRQA